MPIGLANRRRRAVSLEEGAQPGGARCPACGEPLFPWTELIDRCENCGLAVAHDSVPSPEDSSRALIAGAQRRGERIAIRTDNAASLQAWLGAENWAALRSTERVAHDSVLSHSRFHPTPRAVRLLLARDGLDVRRIRHLAAPGMASMWQTLLNLLTFHRDFASEAARGRLRPGTGRGAAAFWLDAVIT